MQNAECRTLRPLFCQKLKDHVPASEFRRAILHSSFSIRRANCFVRSNRSFILCILGFCILHSAFFILHLRKAGRYKLAAPV